MVGVQGWVGRGGEGLGGGWVGGDRVRGWVSWGGRGPGGG